MKSIFYIIVITIILLLLYWNYNNNEHFITRTIEFSDLALNPINISYNTSVSQSVSIQFFKILGRFIPLINDTTQKPEIFTDKNSNILYQYLNNNKTNYRIITQLYPQYLTLLTSYSNSILTFNNVLNNNTIKDIYIIENKQHKILQNMLEILLKKKYNYIFIYQFPKILNKNAYYALFSNEFNSDITALAPYNNYVIIEFPEKHPNYQELKFKFQSLTITKYDVSLQMAHNLRKITYAITDYQCLWTYDYVSETKIYTFTKTLFSNIETVRSSFQSENLKFLFQNLRPEKMIGISVIPIHRGTIKYLHELKLFTYKEHPLCIYNTVTTTNCNPDLLYENRFKLLNLYATTNNNNIFIDI
jgi:hypothetical protein